MSRLSRRPVPLVAATAAVLLAAACGSGSGSGGSTSSTPVSGGSLTYAVDTEPVSWDIDVSQQDITGSIQRNVFDSLVFQDDKGQFHPWLASSWTVAKDLRTYTFHLRKGVTFTDGTPFNAQAVKTNFDRIVDPATTSQYAAGLLGPYSGTKVVDAYTVEVSFTKAFAPFLQAASTPYLGFYSPAAIAKYGSKLGAGGPADVGTGPFVFSSYTKGQSAVLTRNPKYDWAPATDSHQGPAYLDKLTYRFLSQDSVRVGALRSGQVQVAKSVPPADVKTLTPGSGLTVISKQAPGGVYNLVLNASRGPFTDQRVREAVQRGINVDADVKSVYFGAYQRAWSPLSPATAGYDSALTGTWPYDPKLADRLLDQAGWTARDSSGYRTKDGKRLSLVWPLMPQNLVSQQHDILGQAVQADLKKLGIQVERPRQDVGTFVKQLFGGKDDISDYSWARADPDVLRLYFNSAETPAKGGANGTFIKDADLDAWTEQGQTTLDPAARATFYTQVQKRAVDLSLVVPMYVVSSVYGASTHAHGITADANTWLEFHDAWLGK
ncbi:peptide/nickel transport system substrate-binding protein [Actinacidiphila yanglinensis]|uniref:Peptide/nickel transport system substrate-binding protein n=1 Tax=Actinacidiphila yanglinensis TaxID=310779 RepID=A0A1H6DQH0_9ACTN|nr:ABC transporter substrate-binding protein [Actinacidiphila yanglinensis]SEG87491.1 peptide/nickel transport system substrate-binding protein [Actinacidiphila yanglinensis]